MPQLSVAGQQFEVALGSNLLDALKVSGIAVPSSCRAGSCQVCQVRCVVGQLHDAQPQALPAERYAEGWRLACQCRVEGDVQLEVFDPEREGMQAAVVGHDWLTPDVLRLRLLPERLLRYQAGQHLQLCAGPELLRPYSLASLPNEDHWLEFHVQCRTQGAFSDFARQLQLGSTLRLGAVQGGGLHYDPDWQSRPLLLLASGTGLAPLYGVLREALRQGHTAPIRLCHVAHDTQGHYLRNDLLALAEAHPQLALEFIVAAELPAFLAQFRLVERRSIALVCAHPVRVEAFAKSLYLAGLPRAQVFADVFVSANEQGE